MKPKTQQLEKMLKEQHEQKCSESNYNPNVYFKNREGGYVCKRK